MRYVIERLFRRHFFVVQLGGLTLAALICASTASEIAATELEPVRANYASSEVELPDVERRDFAAAADANIFEGRREIVEDMPLQPPPDMNGDCESAPRSTLRLRLVGAVVFEDEASSLASIVDENGKRHAEVFSIQSCDDVATNDPCDRIGTLAHLRRIEPERVCLWNDADQRLESLALDDGPTMVSTTRTAPPPSSVPPNAKGGGPELNVRQLGANRYEVTRSEVEGLLNQPELLQTPATIAFEDGAPVGIKLGRVAPNSLYAKIGLKRGDIINRVNGYDISNPAKALEIYGKLQSASNIVVDVTRAGAKQTIEYSIVP